MSYEHNTCIRCGEIYLRREGTRHNLCGYFTGCWAAWQSWLIICGKIPEGCTLEAGTDQFQVLMDQFLAEDPFKKKQKFIRRSFISEPTVEALKKILKKPNISEELRQSIKTSLENNKRR